MADRGRQLSLEAALETPAGKTRYVRRLFTTIAPRYDFITRVLSFGQDQRWKLRLIADCDLQPGSRVLDLACGTGDLSRLAARRGAEVTAADITPDMVRRAREKRNATRVQWIVGDMETLPLAPVTFDVVTIGYGLRNVAHLETALREAWRVLRPGGRLAALDFNRPESALVRTVYLTYLTVVGSTLGWVLHGDADTYRYIPASIRRYPGAEGVARVLRELGFERVTIVPVLGGLMTIHVADKPTRTPAA
jgi:demethylmenaquinone methyltransferase/2-methoxy-6-polyprenyl-1,4-benzoquinol methylase